MAKVMMKKMTAYVRDREGRYCTVDALVPNEEAAIKTMLMIEPGGERMVDVKSDRISGHHRKFFKLLRTVIDMQERYHTEDQLRAAMMFGLGRFDWIEMPDGSMEKHPHSIAFDSMDQQQFDEFYAQALDWLVREEILPANTPEEYREKFLREIVSFGN